MIAQAGSDPWMQAWRRLRVFIESGATEKEVTEYARELGQGLPDARDPVAYAQQVEAVQRVVTEILS
jgi:hypothetical protein